MRSSKRNMQKTENTYDLSIADLMAALCCIFILFLVFVIHRLNAERKDFEIKNGVATEFRLRQEDLYNAIREEFKNDLIEWEAEIVLDKGTILIRFLKESLMFSRNDYHLKSGFENVLIDFFPRLIEILEDPQYKDDIQEIRIEGHTAIDESLSREEDYETGMILSQLRTREVMFYCLNTIPKQRNEVQKNLIAIGYSNSIPAENIEQSRRVEFSIRTRAENVIEKIEENATDRK